MSDQGEDHERWRWTHTSDPDAYFPDEGGYWQWNHQRHCWTFHYANPPSTESTPHEVPPPTNQGDTVDWE
eukprot:6069398-Heterocapsa_arctica.AAC.1